jgi:hypothetical protein
MQLLKSGNYYNLKVELSRDRLYDLIQVELMSSDSPIDIAMRFVWKKADGTNIDQLNQPFTLQIKDGTPNAENLCEDATVTAYSGVRDRYVAFEEYDEYTTWNEMRTVEFAESFKTKEDVEGCPAVYKL